MAEHVHQVKETTTRDGGTVQTTREVRDPVAEQDHDRNVIERIVWFVAGVLLVLLAFRFLFALLGANPSNGFANFVYSTSHPFVSPFFGLFSYNYQYGVSKFEIYTLVAMVVYTVIAYGIVALVNINRR